MKYNALIRLNGWVKGLLSFYLFTVLPLSAQTLEECQRAAEQNYPLIRQYDLIEKTTNLTVANIGKGWLPQVLIAANAVTRIEVGIHPGQTHSLLDYRLLRHHRLPAAGMDYLWHHTRWLHRTHLSARHAAGSVLLVVRAHHLHMQQAIFVMWFFIVLLMQLSGLFTPTRSMPALAYLTTYVNPMHYFIEAIRTVFIRGGSFQHIWHQIAALTAIALFMGCWAVQSYKKNS